MSSSSLLELGVVGCFAVMVEGAPITGTRAIEMCVGVGILVISLKVAKRLFEVDTTTEDTSSDSVAVCGVV